MAPRPGPGAPATPFAGAAVAQPPPPSPRRRKRVAILTNLVAPYRVPVYQRIGEAFQVSLLLSGRESNRTGWEGSDRRLQGIEVRRSGGLSIGYRLGDKEVYDNRFLHMPFGNLTELVRIRPDAVIANEMGVRSLLALFYGAIFRKPVWIWWGGTPHTERRIGVARKLLRRAFARVVRRWISYGATSTDYLVELGVPRERILQIQNCVDEAVYAPATPPALSLLPRPVFLYVGRMVGLKGIDRLLEAAAALQQAGHEFSLLLVGEGPEQPRYEALAARIGLRNVTFHPAQPPAAMPAIYRSADFLVFPTYDDVWGLVVNEALWSGLPVLCSRYAGCAAELLPAEQIFDPFDPDDFARVLLRAVRGQIAAAATDRLKSCAEVAALINADLTRVLEGSAA